MLSLPDAWVLSQRPFDVVCCVLEKVCAGSNVGWQLLTTDGEEDAFTKAKKPVSTLDNLSSFVDLLKHDAQYDRKRSAKGKYQRK